MVTVSTVSAAELAGLARDAPMFVTNNPIRDFATAPSWKTTAAATGPDVTDTNNGPTRYLYDGRCSPRSRPLLQSPAVGTYYLHFRLTAGTDAKHTVDTVAILNHNLGTLATALGGDLTVTVVVADADDFVSGFRQIARWTTVNSNTRLVQLSLGSVPSNERYTNVTYVRIQITGPANFDTNDRLPQIGEVVFGRRRQMAWPPRQGDYDDVELETLSTTNEFPTGEVFEVVHAERRGHFKYKFRPHGVDAGTGLNENNEIRAWYRESRGSTDAFLVFDKPNTESTKAMWMKKESDRRLYMPLKGPFEREVDIQLIEQPPYYDPEVNP
jgi:hypothetical protein